MSRDTRISLIDSLLDDYITQTGEVPDGSELYRLADIILNDELTDPGFNKVSREEYPILSGQQLKRRSERERAWSHWHINDDCEIGRRTVPYTDDDGTPQIARQRIQKRY